MTAAVAAVASDIDHADSLPQSVYDVAAELLLFAEKADNTAALSFHKAFRFSTLPIVYHAKRRYTNVFRESQPDELEC